jgi:serine/threonine protein kinase
MTASSDPRVGTTLGNYRIDGVLGRGGMGVVYLAEQRDLGRKVALKLLAAAFVDDEAFRARFLRESRMAAAIDHPNIVPIYEAGQVEGAYFLAMRYVDGVDLASRIRSGPLTPVETTRLLGQVASALDAAHAAGLVHRDVKPANLLIASGQGLDRADHVYLTDFGLTKQRGSETGLTRTGSFLGTLEYIAPEQIEGKPIDGRADQYALAAIAVECLTGAAPFPHDTDVAILNAHLRAAPPLLSARRPELPTAVDRVIARGLAKRPEDRYPDCRTFVEDLAANLGVTSTHTQPAAPSRRRSALLIGAVIAVVVVIAAGATLLGAANPVGPSAGPSGAAVASGTPVATSPLAPDLSASIGPFPTDAEVTLRKALPSSLAKACVRGPYDLLTGFGAARPLASLTCPQTIASGANLVVIRQFKYLGLSAGNSGFTIGSFISDLEGGLRLKPGDCATTSRAGGRWQLAGVDAGAMACYTDPQNGDAILWWGYDADAVLVQATNQRGDSAALYGFFQQVGKFITP